MAAQATTTTTPQKVTQSGPTQEAVGSGEGEVVEEPPVNTLDAQVASITAFANERIEAEERMAEEAPMAEEPEPVKFRYV